MAGRKPIAAGARRTQITITIAPDTAAWLKERTNDTTSVGHVIDQLVAKEKAMATEIRTITFEDGTSDYFDGQDTDGVDVDASIDRYSDMLSDRIHDEYPKAEVTIRHHAGVLNFGTKIYANAHEQYDESAHPAIEKAEENVQSIAEALYSDMQQWLVYTE